MVLGGKRCRRGKRIGNGFGDGRGMRVGIVVGIEE